MAVLQDHAPAKVNLTLRILGRRDDGYHEIESLVAFAAVGDDLDLEVGETLSLAVSGPNAGLVGGDGDNLVLKAATRFAEHFPGAHLGRFRLVKRLPVAAGIGGGSSDAAAALRLLARANDLAPDHPELFRLAATIGADVPVCLAPYPRLMRGIGERLAEPSPLPKLFAVLVNPGIPLGTRQVFEELGLKPGETMPAASAFSGDGLNLAAIAAGTNDLEAPSIRLQPVISDVLQALRDQQGCLLARMSGSGATCFGLFKDCHMAAAVAKAISAIQGSWWVMPTLLGGNTEPAAAKS